MIFEIRTYLLKPGTAPQAERRSRDKKAAPSLAPSPAIWRTEVGTLNQIIHIWPYKDVERTRPHSRQAVADQGLAAQDRGLRPRYGIQDPPSSRPSRRISSPASMAAFYEFRTYTYGPGAIPKVIEVWTPRIKERSAVSPLIFAGFTDIGASQSMGSCLGLQEHG